MKKKIVLFICSFAMAGMMLAGCGGSAAGTGLREGVSAAESSVSSTAAESSASSAAADADQGKVYNIYCWNEELKSRVEAYYPGYTKGSDVKDDSGTVTGGTGRIGDVAVNWIITSSKDSAYQNALDKALANQDQAAADDKVDLFLVEADDAVKYTNADAGAAMSVREIGLTEDDMAQQYPYTKEAVTGSDGVQRGTSWEATPGLFAYRRSIAKDVLGTDDPEKVQEALSDWSKFDEAAAKASAKGYRMLSGYDDSYLAFAGSATKKWVDSNSAIQIDDNLMRWVDQTKTYTDKGYNNRTAMWSDQWAADQGAEGKVFGFFYSTWGVNFTLPDYALAESIDSGGKEEKGNGTYGDWAVCQGPASWYWGGIWLCGAEGSDNVAITKDIMEKLTCDQKIMKQITVDTQVYTNNQAAMKELADDPSYESAFFGGQNCIKVFTEAAQKIRAENASLYDQELNEIFQSAFQDYFDGTVDKDTALKNFYQAAVEKYPALKQ